MTRHRGQGATWFKKRAISRRLNVESHHADARDVGGQRIDLDALLGGLSEDFPTYDLDAELAVKAFRAKAHRWLMHRPSQQTGGTHG